MADWKTLSSRIVYESRFMRMHEDKVINPIGEDSVYSFLESTSDAVYVVPVDDEGNTYIIQEYRYPIKKAVWECTAGRNEGDDTETTAKRELLEETGLQAEEIIVIGDIQVASGVANLKNTVCLAKRLTKVSDELDPVDGILAVKKVPLVDIRGKILAGEIQCSQSIAAFFMAIAYLEKEKSERVGV